MTTQELERLVRQGEGQQIEFKRKVRHPERIVREVVAFANSDGGHLLIGVDDNGTIPGLKHVDSEQYVMDQAINDLCRPKIEFEVEQIHISASRSILHYHIQSGQSKPYFAFFQKTHKYGKAFVRVEDRSVQASREIRQILKYQMEDTTQGFAYGEDEKKLLNYLGSNEFITLDRYIEISGISKREASEILIKLTLNNVLEIQPGEGGDRYIFVE